MVSIVAFQAVDPGSIPGHRKSFIATDLHIATFIYTTIYLFMYQINHSLRTNAYLPKFQRRKLGFNICYFFQINLRCSSKISLDKVTLTVAPEVPFYATQRSVVLTNVGTWKHTTKLEDTFNRQTYT